MDEDLSGVSLRAGGPLRVSCTRYPGGESLAVAPYLMDPATVLMERFAKRCAHGVLAPPGFAGSGLGLLDGLGSGQLNVSCLTGKRRKSVDNPNGRFEPCPGKTINSTSISR